MIRFFLAATLLVVACHRPVSKSNEPKDDFPVAEVQRLETTLASDDMMGRRAGTAGAEKAASFIESEFAAIGLDKFPGLNTYRQTFQMIRPELMNVSATVNGTSLPNDQVVVLSQQQQVQVNEQSSFEVVHITSKDNLINESRKITSMNKNVVVLVDTSQRKTFPRLNRYRRPSEPNNTTKVFILYAGDVSTFTVTASQKVSTISYTNVVGVLPGKSRKDESVVFSSHYDHLGIDKPNAAGDSIYNGANDDAAGTTAVIMLARHFRKLNNNERTLVFVAFTAEEVGGFGSGYFSRNIQPDKVMAMFNIEMIGTESKWGTNSAYITGYDKSDMGAILQKNLQGSAFHFYPDPYPAQNLFLRSDNATLAMLGVPAHTISTSKMDVEKYYHTQEDEVETLNMQNMAAIIRAIAISAGTIISGQDTPTRVKADQSR